MTKYYASTSPDVTELEINHKKLAGKLAGECVVLLENDGTLPLLSKGNIALFGNGARSTIKGGTGSGDVNTRDNVNIEQGLSETGFIITTGDWLDRQDKSVSDAKKAYIEMVRKKAKEQEVDEFVINFANPYVDPAPVIITEEDVKKSDSDTAVYVLSRNSGEGADRKNAPGDYLLYQEERKNLEFLGENYKKVILVLNIGGVMDLSGVKGIKGINAVLLMSQLGNLGGNVLADVLTGVVNPSGKLADTWAEKYSDYPSASEYSHNNNNLDDEYYKEGIFVGYRYFDSFGIKPLYSFGYGKSYTEFSVETIAVTVEDTTVIVETKVKNTGNKYSGKEVVQVYYHAPQGETVKPYKELAAFKKTSELKPGESETLSISFDIKDMASYIENGEKEGCWLLEKGDYVVSVGNSSDNTGPEAVITLTKQTQTKLVRKLENADKKPDEIIPEKRISINVSENIRRIVIDNPDSLIKPEKITYTDEKKPFKNNIKEKLVVDDIISGKCSVEEFVAQLSVEELASVCVGHYKSDNASVLGNASSAVPGAAGDTTYILNDSRGLKNLIMADGPAGLRLQPVFKTKKNGELIPGGEVLVDSFTPFPDNLDENDIVTYYQYCTAIPIGWALAQSWNMDILEEIGDMVGTEMEQFGVDLWLAPALNIHRNPLCGRNFEYYSEDPLISGKAAAAITRGVQRHAGKGTTIKHFAANNQEDNRFFTNAHVSERALREIYLKGFEIAVKESQPLAIMTSYNLINGTHSANHYDMIQSVARDEWGFDGMVMTDWCTSQDIPEFAGVEVPKYPISASTGCIAAGNDLQMPGCRKNVDDIVEAIKEDKEIDGYRITLGELQYSAAKIINIIVKTMQ
jgi:beta-glucosidase